jgi:hypothetical protein
MTKDEQIIFFEAFTQKQKDVMLSKGDDYAGGDRLSNFKKAGTICGLNAELNCLNLIATKVARLGELLNGKEPKNESVEDSILDLANYSILLAMIRNDKNK